MTVSLAAPFEPSPRRRGHFETDRTSSPASPSQVADIDQE